MSFKLQIKIQKLRTNKLTENVCDTKKMIKISEKNCME